MLEAFTKGLLLIGISELGDKTFFIAMILSIKHSRKLVLLAAIAALGLMTVLSALMGQVASLLPKIYIEVAEFILFFVFGIKLLYDAIRMGKITGESEIIKEANAEVNAAGEKIPKYKNVKYKNIFLIFLEAFLLIFTAEWGDRTQIATIALAAGNNPVAVSSGAILGHTICAAIAVTSGRFLNQRISERQITLAGGFLFLVFATLAVIKIIAM